MRSTILHVGPHKTGSTYLQKCFSHHRAALSKRGILFPSVWEHARDNPSHTGLVRALQQSDDLNQEMLVVEEAFGRQADGNSRLLISAEDLSVIKIEALMRLREMLAGSQVTVVFYVRRWSDILPSSWQESVKQGHSASFPEFLSTHLRSPEDSHTLNFGLRLASLIEVFGRDSVRIVCYSTLLDRGQDIFTHFTANFLDWNDAAPPSGKLKPNVSLDPLRVDLLRRLNSIALSRTGQRLPVLRGRLDAAWSRLELRPILDAMQGCGRIFVFNDRYPALQRLHERIRADFDRNTVEPRSEKLFFQPKRREMSFVADDYLMRPGVVDAINRIYLELTPDH